jgi:hypothetical protein
MGYALTRSSYDNCLDEENTDKYWYKNRR